MIMINPRGSNIMNRALSRQGGFTLIELMIVVAVIAILAAIAYPSYQDSVRKGRRGEAKSDLVELAQAMERCFTQNNSYHGCASIADATDTLIAPFDKSPQAAAATARYTIVMTVPGGAAGRTVFSLAATPVGDQLKDSCGPGPLTLNQTGAKGPATGSTGIPCW